MNTYRMGKKNMKNGSIRLPKELFETLMCELFITQEDYDDRAREGLRKGWKFLPRHWVNRRKTIFLLRARLGNVGGWHTAREDVR